MQPANPDLESDDLEVLLFETSPYGTIDAIVQTDRQSVYFYLYPKGENLDFVPKACWIRNLVPAPYIINQDDYVAGRQVLLPRTHLKPNASGRLPQSDQLKIVWFEEGTGAALIENLIEHSGVEHSGGADSNQSSAPTEIPANGKIVGVIPPWSGHNGFHGFAADCAMDSPICWPLPKNPRLRERIEQATEFWSSFLAPPDPFVVLQERLQSIYDRMFLTGSEVTKKYYRIDGATFPPCGLLEYVHPDGVLLVTVAMSLCPQPNVELAVLESRRLARIELAIFLEADRTADCVTNARNQLALLGSYPWRYLRWLAVGHTCQFPNVFTESDNVQLLETAAMQLRTAKAWLNQVDQESTSPLLDYRNDPVNLLWLAPAPK